MSDMKSSDAPISNEATLLRRQWVDRAIAGARGRFSGVDTNPKMRDKPPRPQLLVVGSRRTR